MQNNKKFVVRMTAEDGTVSTLVFVGASVEVQFEDEETLREFREARGGTHSDGDIGEVRFRFDTDGLHVLLRGPDVEEHRKLSYEHALSELHI